eukprot:TRINITY_DN1854_c0_g2_i1.p1 TRINITY_DN1854_c0_g2~~TRINITY_DN1854_c0_g2_i1.p1  ORF type:complete len:373 (+),score=74.64 TRINITY_DN1854_c0_g2_i1:42-1121(+)
MQSVVKKAVMGRSRLSHHAAWPPKMEECEPRLQRADLMANAAKAQRVLKLRQVFERTLEVPTLADLPSTEFDKQFTKESARTASTGCETRPTPRPSPRVIPRKQSAAGTQTAAVLAAAKCCMLIGALGSATAGLLTGAALCGAISTFFAPLTFGLSVPVSVCICSGTGLWLGALGGAFTGAAFGAVLGFLAERLGFDVGRVDPGRHRLMLALATFITAAFISPPCAAIGAMMGLLSGSCLGMLAGLLLAPFTFGLSVPLAVVAFAVIGSSVDGAAGAFVGGCASVFVVRHRSSFVISLASTYELLVGAARHLWLQLVPSTDEAETEEEDDTDSEEKEENGEEEASTRLLPTTEQIDLDS